ncbi:NAD-dependent protein deacetylase [soil metagenome]
MNTAEPLPTSNSVRDLSNFLTGRRVLVLSGAGLSTESGIPDYRGPETGKRPRNPMRYQEFVGSAAARQRYWARSFRGWSNIQQARPNAGHAALAQLEAGGVVTGVITQNVDGLHFAAGSREVLELHGSLARVRCLSCGREEARPRLQRRLFHLNPDLETFVVETATIAPDGDAEVPPDLVATFRVPSCLACGGVLKPDVVFFGENVPKERVERAWRLFDAAEVLLVVGSSLTVFSGYRFVVAAAKAAKPVAVVNVGVTRGDACATLKLERPLGEVLPLLAETLLAETLLADTLSADILLPTPRP